MTTITDGQGDDSIRGSAENDLVLADRTPVDYLGGDDTVYGLGGNDTVYGFGGKNRIWGGDGDDVLITADGNDKIWGDAGNDDVQSGRGDDTVYGGAGNDTLRGGEDKDLLFGEDGDDRLIGSSNADVLTGGAGRDTLEGRSGSDLLNLGKDGETDTVVFTNDDLGAVDRIRQMDAAAPGGDLIDLSHVDAGGWRLDDVGSDIKIYVKPTVAADWKLLAIVEDIASVDLLTDNNLLV